MGVFLYSCDTLHCKATRQRRDASSPGSCLWPHMPSRAPEKRLCARRRSASAVRRPKPSSDPLALRPLRSTAVTRPFPHITRPQTVRLPPTQASPRQVDAPGHAGCAGQERTQTASSVHRCVTKRPPGHKVGQQMFTMSVLV